MFIAHILFKKNHTKALYLIFTSLAWNSCAAMDNSMQELIEMANQGDTNLLYQEVVKQLHNNKQPGSALLLPQIENFFAGMKCMHKASYDPKKAKGHLEAAIAVGIDPDITAVAQDLLALLYRDHFSKEDSAAHTQANKIFTDLKKKGFAAGAFGLALYALDRQDYITAYSLLENTLKLKEYKRYYSDETKLHARLGLAHMWENGLIPGKKADIKQACRLFEQADLYESEGISKSSLSQKDKDAMKKPLPLMGRLNRARLILTDKLSGDKEEALNIVREGAEKSNEVGVLYGCYLIMSGKNSEGVAHLEKSLVGDFDFDAIFLAKLQLGIAYFFGYGVEQLKEQEAVAAQAVLAKKNSAAKQAREQAQQELMEAEDKSAAKKGKGKKTTIPAVKREKKRSENKIKAIAGMIQATSSSPSGQESLAPTIELKANDPDIKELLGTIEVWNGDWFLTDDGSFVELIDYDKKILVTNDPKMEEKILFIVTDDLHKKRRVIPPFRYHERIALRQEEEVSARTAYNHKFAQKLDYIMQQFGHYVPVLNIRGKTDEALTGLVIRQKKDGQCTVCRAEYTFGRKGSDVYVYHRLLRPITDKQIISEMIEKYIQG